MDLSNLIYDQYYRTNDPALKVILRLDFATLGKISPRLEILNMTSQDKHIRFKDDKRMAFSGKRIIYRNINLNTSTIDIRSLVNGNWHPLQIVHEVIPVQKKVEKLEEEVQSVGGKVDNLIQQTIPEIVKQRKDTINPLKQQVKDQSQTIDSLQEQQKADKEDLTTKINKLNQQAKNVEEKLRTEIQSLERQVESVRNRLAELKELSTISEDWESIQQQYRTVLARYESIEPKLKPLEDDINQLTRLAGDGKLDRLEEAAPTLQEVQKIATQIRQIADTANEHAKSIETYLQAANTAKEQSQKLIDEVREVQANGQTAFKVIKETQENVGRIGDEISDSAQKLNNTRVEANARFQQLAKTFGKLQTLEYQALERQLHEFQRIFHQAANEMSRQRQEEILPQGGSQSVETSEQILQTIADEFDRFRKRLPDGVEVPGGLLAAEKRLSEAKNFLQNPVPFNLPKVPSPQEYQQKQADTLASLALSGNRPKEIPSYLPTIRNIYWRSLVAYADELRTTDFQAQARQVQGKVEDALNDIVSILLDTFDSHRAKTQTQLKIANDFNQAHLPKIVKQVGLEIIPIEEGKTKADSRIHTIQGTKRGKFESGVIVEVVQHGLRRISDKQVVRKPTVIRGEPA